MPRIDLLATHRRLAKMPLGGVVFSHLYRAAAPYFLTVPAHLEDLEPGRAVASMPAVPWTRNHLGGVHAIAQCNLAEYTMGAAAEATVPKTHRWVPKGMTVAYDAIGRGRLTATATLELPAELPEKAEVPVSVEIRDGDGELVTPIEIRIWVSRRRDS